MNRKEKSVLSGTFKNVTIKRSGDFKWNTTSQQPSDRLAWCRPVFIELSSWSGSTEPRQGTRGGSSTAESHGCAVRSWTVSFHFTPAPCACTAGGVKIDLSIKRLSTEQFQSVPLSFRAKDLIIVIYQMCPFEMWNGVKKISAHAAWDKAKWGYIFLTETHDCSSPQETHFNLDDKAPTCPVTHVSHLGLQLSFCDLKPSCSPFPTPLHMGLGCRTINHVTYWQTIWNQWSVFKTFTYPRYREHCNKIRSPQYFLFFIGVQGDRSCEFPTVNHGRRRPTHSKW